MSSSLDDLTVLRLFGKIRRQLNLNLTQSLKPVGIGPKQALLLRELRELKAASPSQLAQATLTDPTAAGKIIESLVKKDWIRRTDHPDDRRRWQVMLTDEGRKAAQKLDGIFRSIAQDFCKPLEAREKDSLFKLLTGISNHLQGSTPSTPSAKDQP